MKHLYLIIALCCIGLNVNAQNYEWADFLHSDDPAYTQYVAANALDEEGNIYTLGAYERTRYIAEDTIRTYGGYSCFIMKHNSEGEFQWINPIGTRNYDIARDLIYSNGSLYASMRLYGDTIYHRDGKFKKKTYNPQRDYVVLKLDKEGNLNDSTMFQFNTVDYTTSMEVVDTLIYMGIGRDIYKLNHDLEKVGQLTFPGPWYVTFEDFSNVNDTALLFVGKFQESISYQDTTVLDTYSGSGSATFYGLLNTEDSLAWMKSYGRVMDNRYIAYEPNSSQWYLAGSYFDDFELQGHIFDLANITGWHGYLASFDLDGQLKEAGTIYPMGGASVQVKGIMTEDNHVFIYGKPGYGMINYNQEDTIHTTKQRYGFLFKLNQDLEHQYNTFIYSDELYEAEISAGVMRNENMYFGGRIHGPAAYMGCDSYESGGYFVSLVKDEAPDETPVISMDWRVRTNGKYYFKSFIKNHDYHYWDFGDGSPVDSFAINPVHQFSRNGEIPVRLVAGNKCGTSTAEKIVKIEGLGFLSPDKSANTNLYLGRIKGVGFKEDVSFKLISKSGVEKEIRETVFIDSLTAAIMVEFNDAPLESFDLYMQNGEDRDSIMDALQLEPETKARIVCEWNGPNFVLGMRAFSYGLKVKNLSNTTAYGVPITVLLGPKEADVYADAQLIPIAEIAGSRGAVLRTFVHPEYDTVKMSSFIIPAIPPRGTMLFRYSIRVPSNEAGGFNPPLIFAYYDPPLMQPQNFLTTGQNNDSIPADSLICPGNHIIDSLMSVFGIDPYSVEGFNLSNLGCVLYSHLLESFRSAYQIGNAGYGGGNTNTSFLGDSSLSTGSTLPLNMYTLIIDAVEAANPGISDAELNEVLDNIHEILPDVYNDLEEEQINDGESITVEYPEDILCVTNCGDQTPFDVCNADGNGGSNGCGEDLYAKLTSKDLPWDGDPDHNYAQEAIDELDARLARIRKFKLDYIAGKKVIVRESRDPNEKYTRQGFGAGNCITQNLDMPYRITFENMDSATAPASEVFIYDTLDLSVLDTANFQWQSFGWGEHSFAIEQSGLHIIEDIDTRDFGGNTIVRFEGNVDSLGILSGVFTTLDTLTWALTDNILDGFLPPNKTAPEGEGFISFSIAQKPNLPHGTRIENSATIIFDYNEPIATSTVFNTIDTVAPVTSVVPFSATSQSDTIVHVALSGMDDGSGLKGFKIFIKRNSGPFTLLALDYPENYFTLSAAYGDTLSFFTFAEDSVGNVERKALTAEATIIIETPTSKFEELEENREFKVYPNPAENILYFETPESSPAEDVRLIDISGKTVIIQRNIHSLDISNVQPGIYILYLKSKTRVHRQSIIIK